MEPPDPARSKHGAIGARIALAAILAFHAVRSLWRLGTPNVWIDEAASWWGVSGSWRRLAEHVLAADDCGGFLYSVLLRLWTSVAGTSEVALRLPSVLFAVLLAAVVFAVGRRLWGDRAGLYGALVTGLYPVVFLQSRQARCYVLLLLLYALVLLGLTLLLGGRRRAGSLWIAGAGSLLVVTHVFGVVALSGAMAVAAVAAFVAPGRRPAANPAAKLAANLAPFVPPLVVQAGWLALLWQRVESRRDTFWLDPEKVSIGGVYLGLVEYVLPIVLAAALLRGRGRTARRLAGAGALLAIPILLGPPLATLASRGDHHFVLERYFLPLVVPAALALGYLLSRLPPRLGGLAAAAILAASMGKPGTVAAYREGAPHGTLSRQAADFLRREVRGAGTPVFVYPHFQAWVLDYYGAPDLYGAPSLREAVDDWTCQGLRPALDAARTRGARAAWVVHFDCRRGSLDLPGARWLDRRRFGPLSVDELALAPVSDPSEGGAGSGGGSPGTPGSPPGARTRAGPGAPGRSSAPPPRGSRAGAPGS